MHDIVEFLRLHPPSTISTSLRSRSSRGRWRWSSSRPGSTIFRQGAEPSKHVRVVRRGAVELVDRGRVLDLLGEGELFGHASMLAGLPTGFEAGRRRTPSATGCPRTPWSLFWRAGRRALRRPQPARAPEAGPRVAARERRPGAAARGEPDPRRATRVRAGRHAPRGGPADVADGQRRGAGSPRRGRGAGS